MLNLSEQVWLAIISMIGASVTTYLTLKFKSARAITDKNRPHKDRMDTIYDGYEKLIKQQQEDIERKSQIINQLESIVDRLEAELNNTRGLLDNARAELLESHDQNKIMQLQLANLRKQQEAVQ